MQASAADTKHARALLSKNAAAEKELKLLLSRKDRASGRQVVSLRASIRDNYEEILFLDYAFASRKEVEQQLWKIAFYRPIEEFRRRIRKVGSAGSSSSSAPSAVAAQQVYLQAGWQGARAMGTCLHNRRRPHGLLPAPCEQTITVPCHPSPLHRG